MPDSAEIPVAVHDQLSALTQPHPMRRGSLSERYMKCGKPSCPCAHDPKARHGPYFSLTRGVGGQTRSRMLTAEQVAAARAQIDAGQQFRRHLEQYWQACEQWADTQLQAPEAASKEAAKKGASNRRSRLKSRQKSKR
jgi:hypothetical protein